MAQVKNRISLETIRKVIEPIVAQFHPQKVILFGSHACGEPTKDSDVDLLVMMETGESPLHVAARIAASIEHPFPLDIIVRTPAELDASLQRKGGFAVEVATKGVTMYEARDTGMDR